MKESLKKRLRNPYFYVGLLGVVLTALQVEASTLTTWNSVLKLIIDTVQNPYLLFTVAMAVTGVFVDPTTAGLTDEDREERRFRGDL